MMLPKMSQVKTECLPGCDKMATVGHLRGLAASKRRYHCTDDQKWEPHSAVVARLIWRLREGSVALQGCVVQAHAQQVWLLPQWCGILCAALVAAFTCVCLCQQLALTGCTCSCSAIVYVWLSVPTLCNTGWQMLQCVVGHFACITCSDTFTVTPAASSSALHVRLASDTVTV